jgi:hypothetical protein
MSDRDLNVQDLLFDSKPQVSHEVRRKMEDMPAGADLKAEVAKKSRLIKWDVVSDVLLDRAVEMSDIPVAKILLSAWRKYREIEKFTDPHAYPPEDTELVSLLEHTVQSEHKSSLEILFKGARVKVIDFTVATELTLEGVVLQIRGGRVMAIEAGTVKGKASLAMESKIVVEKPFASIHLPGKIDLGEGVPLRAEVPLPASSASRAGNL